jgi:hypothetical protein
MPPGTSLVQLEAAQLEIASLRIQWLMPHGTAMMRLDGAHLVAMTNWCPLTPALSPGLIRWRGGQM